MKRFASLFVVALMLLALPALLLGQEAKDKKEPPAKGHEKHEIAQEELSSTIPALGKLHTVVRPMWHEGYANKNFTLIKELLPRADTLVANLDQATLPGILRDKQAAWDAKKADLKAALTGLHAAAKSDNQDEMLKQTELFHSSYEQLVRTVRPMVPELDAFHQELYKLYHYYAPEYDLAKIRAAAAAMEEKLPPLKAAKLPKRLAERQAEFDAHIAKLEAEVKALGATAKADSKDEILKAVEKVHTEYQKLEHMFD